MCNKNGGSGSIRDIIQHNRKLYLALSELFIDNEVDYHYIAAEVKSYPLEQVKKALFYDVAPVCYFNLMTPIPPVWAGFNEKWLLLEIMRIKHQQKTVIGRIKLFWLFICVPNLKMSGNAWKNYYNYYFKYHEHVVYHWY